MRVSLGSTGSVVAQEPSNATSAPDPVAAMKPLRSMPALPFPVCTACFRGNYKLQIDRWRVLFPTICWRPLHRRRADRDWQGLMQVKKRLQMRARIKGGFSRFGSRIDRFEKTASVQPAMDR